MRCCRDDIGPDAEARAIRACQRSRGTNSSRIGAEDVLRDASLRQSREVDAAQGHTRLDRAFRYADAFTTAAQARGITPDIKITVLPRCGHDFIQCAEVGGLATRILQQHPVSRTKQEETITC